ncbi:MAG: ATP-grasp domain-containing protein [Planctomycetaceae bacterium]
MIRATESQRTILVTDAGRGSALSMIRSLGRRGHRVIAADFDARSPGFRSRFTSASIVYPMPWKQPDAFVDRLLEVVRAESVDLVIPVTDDTIFPLSAHRREFPATCRLAFPDALALEVTTNKQKTLELAMDLGVPTPRTAVVETVTEALAAVDKFQWPVVLKPLVSRLFREHDTIERFTVGYAENSDSLARQMAAFEGHTPVLLQEYVSGTGYGVELLLQEGRVVAAFQHRRLREIPVSGGASSFRESVPLDPELFEYAARMMTSLNWNGLAMVEFKEGADGFKLMEINGRPWGSLPLAVASGVDFPGMLADITLGEQLPSLDGPKTNYELGVRARNLELDLIWIGTVLSGYRRYPFLPIPPRSQAISAICGMFNPANRFDIQSLADPGPGIADLPRIVRKFWKKFQRGRKPSPAVAADRSVDDSQVVRSA